MGEIFHYLTGSTPTFQNKFNIPNMIKVAFYTIIYENILIKEALSVIDLNSKGGPPIIHSNYDSSSDDGDTTCRTIEYNKGAFHNYFAISDFEKLEWMNFLSILKVIDHKDIQITFREQPIADDYKLMLTGIHTDPFGEIHEKRRDVETDEVANFVLNVLGDDLDPAASLNKLLEYVSLEW